MALLHLQVRAAERDKVSHLYKVSSAATAVIDYHETFSYNGNGNIKNVSRYYAATPEET